MGINTGDRDQGFSSPGNPFEMKGALFGGKGMAGSIVQLSAIFIVSSS